MILLVLTVIYFFSVLAIYCDEISDIYFGVSVTWERTPTDVTAQYRCTGDELTGMAIVKSYNYIMVYCIPYAY